MDDAAIPLCRPSETVPYHASKYPWMEHAETNALANTSISLWSACRPVTAYVTGTCCFECSKALCRHGVTDWVFAERKGWTNPPEGEAENIARLVDEKGVIIRRLSPDLNWVVDPDFLAEMRSLGFMGDSR